MEFCVILATPPLHFYPDIILENHSKYFPSLLLNGSMAWYGQILLINFNSNYIITMIMGTFANTC